MNELYHKIECLLFVAGEPVPIAEIGRVLQLDEPAVRQLLSDMEACYRAAMELYDETSAANPQFKRVWDHFKAYRETQLQWFRVAENSYDSFVYAMQAQEQQARR